MPAEEPPIAGVESTVGTVPNVDGGPNERGLLGIAVDPKWPSAPYIYVHQTRLGSRIAISRFTLTGDLNFTTNGLITFLPSSRFDLLNDLPDNATNHNGGTVRFGPDGNLYVSLGDDAVSCAAQDTSALQGKILRLDVTRLPATGTGPAPKALLIPPGNPFAANPDSSDKLVWALGLRNPFRFHIDPGTGDLFIADVGQDTWEEYDRISGGGADLGWPFREGPDSYSSCPGFSTAGFIEPIGFFDHSEGAAIMSAGVYRVPGAGGPPAFPNGYEGNCFYTDYYTGIMRRLVGSGTTWQAPPEVEGQPSPQNWGEGFDAVSDFLEMPDGSLWYCRQSVNFGSGTGEIRRIRCTDFVGVPESSSSKGGELRLAAPRPTPSSNRVTLSWTQPRPGAARLVVFDASGRAVRVIEAGAELEAGSHSRTWDGLDASGQSAPTGLYFARLDAGGEVRNARIALVR